MTLAEYRTRYPERLARVGGHDWPHVDTGGMGTPLVMLPGAQGTHEMFWRQVTALGSDGRRCIAVSTPAEFDTARLVKGLAAFLDTIGVGQLDLLGSSFGGYVAGSFAARHPARIRHLILANTFADATAFQAKAPRTAAQLRVLPAEQIRDELLGRVAAMPEATPEQAEFKAFLADQVTRRQSAENLQSRLHGVLAAIPVPRLDVPDSVVTIIDCEDDRMILPEMKADLRARHPGARVVVLPHGGHYPGLLNAEAYTAAIREALR